MADIVKKGGAILRAREGFVVRQHNPGALNDADFGATALALQTYGTQVNTPSLVLTLDAVPNDCAKLRIVVFGEVEGRRVSQAVKLNSPEVGVIDLGYATDLIPKVLGSEELTFHIEGARAGESFGRARRRRAAEIDDNEAGENEQFRVVLPPFIPGDPIAGQLVAYEPAQFEGVPDSGPVASFVMYDDNAGTNPVTLNDATAPAGSAGKFFRAIETFTDSGATIEVGTEYREILASASTVPPALEVTLVRTEYDPAGQSEYWRPVLRFENEATAHQSGLTSPLLQWTTSQYTNPEIDAPQHIEDTVIPHPTEAGAWIIRMDQNPDAVPSGSNRNGRFDLWRAGDDNRQLRVRSKYDGGTYSPWSPFNFTIPAPQPVAPPPGDPGEPGAAPWRPMTRRGADFLGSQHVNLPAYTNLGLYAGEGYQNLECGAWAADGSAMIVGQDMGNFRISIAEAGLPAGATWSAAPFRGMRGSHGLSAMFDPGDSNTVLVLNGPGNMLGNTASQFEGIWLSEDKGKTARMVQSVPKLTNDRRFRQWFAAWPRSGGNPSTRKWYMIAQRHDRLGAPKDDPPLIGHIYKANSGPGNWNKIRDINQNTYGFIFEVIQSNVEDKLWLSTSKGVWETTNGFNTIGRTNWGARFNQDSRRIWQDPDNANHLIVSVTSSNTADRGLWESFNGGSGWTRIFNNYNPAHFDVGAKDSQGRRRMVVYAHKPSVVQKIYVRKIGGAWALANYLKQTKDSQHSGLMMYKEQTGFVYCSPTNPDMAVVHGRSVIYYSKPGTDFTYFHPGIMYFGSETHTIVENSEDPNNLALTHTDQGMVITRNAWKSAFNNGVTGEIYSRIAQASKRIRSAVMLPFPWPNNAPAPADNKAPGRTIGAFGSTFKNLLLIQQNREDQGNSDSWTTRPKGASVASGGELAYRHFIAVHEQNPNIVYAGVNRTLNAGGSWLGSWQPIVAMDFVNSNIVYGFDNNNNTGIYRSEDRGASGSLIVRLGHSAFAESNYGLLYAIPGRQNAMIVGNVVNGKQDIAIMRLNSNGAFNDLIDLNVRSRMPSVNVYQISRVSVNYGAPRNVLVSYKIAGVDFAFMVRLNSSFTGVESIANITDNLPLLASGGGFQLRASGETVIGGPNGTYIRRAPADWSGPAGRRDTIFENCPKAILGVRSL